MDGRLRGNGFAPCLYPQGGDRVMNNTDIRSLYGLKYNPFLPDLPPEALYDIPGTASFALRVRSMAEHGGFALITGEPGLGKSKTLQKIAHQLEQIPDLTVGVMQRPPKQAGRLFTGRWGSCSMSTCPPPTAMAASKPCETVGKRHCQSTLLKPVLLIDESQQVSTECLTELRILQSDRFDSKSLLFTILCGDNRLPDRFPNR